MDVIHPGIPGAINQWFPSQGQARRAALGMATQFGPDYTIDMIRALAVVCRTITSSIQTGGAFQGTSSTGAVHRARCYADGPGANTRMKRWPPRADGYPVGFKRSVARHRQLRIDDSGGDCSAPCRLVEGRVVHPIESFSS